MYHDWLSYSRTGNVLHAFLLYTLDFDVVDGAKFSLISIKYAQGCHRYRGNLPFVGVQSTEIREVFIIGSWRCKCVKIISLNFLNTHKVVVYTRKSRKSKEIFRPGRRHPKPMQNPGVQSTAGNLIGPVSLPGQKLSSNLPLQILQGIEIREVFVMEL